MAESKLVCLDRENWPEWFFLDFAPAAPGSTPAILIGIKEWSLHWLTETLRKNPSLETYKRYFNRYGLEGCFSLDVTKSWGFGDVLQPQASTEGFRVYSTNIPQVEKETDETCMECDGGKKGGGGEHCLRCDGTGRETKLVWGDLLHTTATFSVLSSILLDKPEKWPLEGISSRRKQLLSLCLHFGEGAAYIGATLAEPFADYLRSQVGEKLPKVRSAVKEAEFQMFPHRRKFGDFGYRAYIQNGGQLIVEIAAVCSLYIGAEALRKNGAMQLDSNNADSPAQQLALLAGLAALSGMVRKELYRS